MKKALLMIVILVCTLADAMAQCAMCRSTLENNYSNGNPGIASGINTGILYLLVLPYLAILITGYLWFKASKNGGKELTDRIA